MTVAIDEVRDRVAALPVREGLYPMVRALALQPRDYGAADYTKARAAQLVDAIMACNLDAVGAAYGALPESVRNRRAPARSSNGTGAPDAEALADAVRAIAAAVQPQAPSVDADEVRRIAREELAAVRSDATVRIELSRPDAPTPKVIDGARPELARLLRCAAAGVNAMLVGPAGCGKTHLAHQVAQALDRPFAALSLTSGTSESALLGWRLPIDGGAWVYTPSPFVKLYEGGGVFLFDEIDAADPNMLLVVNQALSNGHFYLPARADRPEVKRHPDFVAVAAANTWGTGADAQYVGRERLDESTLDRFRAGMIALDYDADLERRIGAPDVVVWAQALRASVREHKLRRVVSTRLVIDGSKLRLAGAPLAEIQASALAGWTDAERRQVGAQ